MFAAGAPLLRSKASLQRGLLHGEPTMTTAFYLAALVAVASTVMVVSNRHPVHALLYLIVSLFAVAVIFFVLGAPLAAALEVIIYAGAIMVLFVFVVMMLNLGDEAATQERRWLTPRVWIGPAVLSAVLLLEMLYLLFAAGGGEYADTAVGAHAVGLALFGPYVLVVELAAMLLLAPLVGAFHLGQRLRAEED